MLGAKSILDQANKRWEAILTLQPELGATVSVQRRLVERGLSLSESVTKNTPVTARIEPEEILNALRAGTPVFIKTAFEVAGEALMPFVLGFCDDLAGGGDDSPSSRLGLRLENGEIDIGSLIAASLGRQQEAIRTKAHHVGISPDLLWLVAELAAGPIAHRLQRELLTNDESACALSASWGHGFCPACSSWPAFAERIENRRSLRCSFCASTWAPAIHECIYCQESGKALILATPNNNSSALLEMCRQCGGYLKSLAVESPTPVELLPVADLETSTLDLGAVEQGYSRPTMRDFSTEGLPPCPPIIET